MVDHCVSSDNIELIEESAFDMKIVHSISIEKYVWVLKGVDLQGFNNIIVHDFICFIPFKWLHLTETLSGKCLSKRFIIDTHTILQGLWLMLILYIDNIWCKSSNAKYLASNWSIVLKLTGVI